MSHSTRAKLLVPGRLRLAARWRCGAGWAAAKGRPPGALNCTLDPFGIVRPDCPATSPRASDSLGRSRRSAESDPVQHRSACLPQLLQRLSRGVQSAGRDVWAGHKINRRSSTVGAAKHRSRIKLWACQTGVRDRDRCQPATAPAHSFRYSSTMSDHPTFAAQRKAEQRSG